MAAALGRAWLCRVLRNTGLGPRASRQAAFAFLQNDRIHSFTRSLASHDGRSSALGKILSVTKQETEDVGRQYPPAVSVSKAEQDYLLLHQPDQPENSQVLRVAIIGAPNAGKSTLSNRLLGRKVFPVSSKVHTTRCRAQGVITDGATQILLLTGFAERNGWRSETMSIINHLLRPCLPVQCVTTPWVLLDTPGLISAVKAKRHNLEKSLLDDPWQSVKEADLVLVLVDISDHWTRNKLHTELLKCLSKYPHLPAVLVLNKVDLLKNKGLLLELTARLTEGVVNNRKLKIKSRFNSLPQQSTLSRNVSGKDRTGRQERGDGEAPIATGAWDGEYVMNKNALSEDSPGDSEFPHVEVSTDCVSGSDGSVQQPADTGSARPQGLAGQHGDSKHREGWPHFKEVFMLSAVNGEEVETLQRYLMTKAQPGSWDYHSAVVTDQSPQEICCNLIRERLLEHLPQEVPYNIIQSTELWEEGPSGELRILQNITVARKNHARLLIGQGGQLIGKIARDVGQDLMNIFLCDVQLKLCVKVKK